MSIITNHGKKRIRERAGLKSKAAQANSDRAFNEGLDRKELSGSLRRYVDYWYHFNDENAQIKIYNNMVYIFKKDILITMFQLPSRYTKIVKTINDKKKESEDNGQMV